MTDHRWTIGNHPFGPFASGVFISEAIRETVHRNSIISRISKALSLLQQSSDLIQLFGQKYLSGNLISQQEAEGNFDVFVSWIDLLYHSDDPDYMSDVSDPLSDLRSISRLHDELEALGIEFGDIFSLVAEHK